MKVTVLIKSHLRHKLAIECVECVRKYYDYPIIIADDSYGLSQSHFSKFKDVTFYQQEYDIGLGGGRNFLLGKVDTPYFLLLDHDQILDEPGKVEKLYAILREVDGTISSGCLWDVGKPRIRRFVGFFSYQEGVMMHFYDLARIQYKQIGDAVYCGCQFAENFFLGKTDDFDKWNIKWIDEIPAQEHEDFYFRFPKSLRVTFSPNTWVKHKHVQEDETKYYNIRYGEKLVRSRKYIMNKYGYTYIDKHRRGYFFPHTLHNVYDWTSWEFPPFITVKML